jgi:uncharacterized protein involved in exopolysaccharide biosynthesis
LDHEIADITARRQKLARLEPQYQELARQRDLLTTNVRSLAQREQESQAAQALAQAGDDGSVKVIQRAYTATQGSSFKGLVLACSLAFAAFAALCLGLFLSFVHKGYPTPQTVERVTELPVLVTTPAK